MSAVRLEESLAPRAFFDGEGAEMPWLRRLIVMKRSVKLQSPKPANKSDHRICTRGFPLWWRFLLFANRNSVH